MKQKEDKYRKVRTAKIKIQKNRQKIQTKEEKSSFYNLFQIKEQKVKLSKHLQDYKQKDYRFGLKIQRRQQFQLIFQLIQQKSRLGYKYFISLMIMNEFLDKLQKIQNNRDLLRKTCKINLLPITTLNGFTNCKIQIIYERLLKHYRDHPEKAKTIWFQNQLKIFFWVVVSISLLQNKKIKNFDQPQWSLLQKIFTQKDQYTFKYQLKRILSSGRKNSRVWNSQQNQLLKEIMSDLKMKNKWNEVARLFYAKSDNKYFRTGKQCREHWLNHLDPLKKHGKWDNQEDLQILKYVFQNGKKWSLIAKELMKHRTQHMIKNRFKALIFQEKKKWCLNEQDESKLLKKIIKRISLNQQKLELNEIKFHKSQKNELKDNIQPEDKILQSSHDNYNSTLNGKTPLNNLNFQNMIPFVYIWSYPVQIITNYQIMGPINKPEYSSLEMNRMCQQLD